MAKKSFFKRNVVSRGTREKALKQMWYMLVR